MIKLWHNIQSNNVKTFTVQCIKCMYPAIGMDSKKMNQDWHFIHSRYDHLKYQWYDSSFSEYRNFQSDSTESRKEMELTFQATQF